MNNQAYLVDDDEAIRDALTWLLISRGVQSQCWDSAEAFLADYRAEMSGCLILDMRMVGMTGLELFDRLLEQGCAMPVIFLTGHADVPLAVAALKRALRFHREALQRQRACRSRHRSASARGLTAAPAAPIDCGSRSGWPP